jgi:hypothetical protein
MPGVVIHAQIVSQILSAVLNNRPLIGYWSQWGEILWIWGWSIVGGILAWHIRKPWLFGLAGGALLCVLVGISYSLFLLAVWVPLVPPAFALIGTAVSLEVPEILLVINQVLPSFDVDALKQEVQKTYSSPVAGILPHSEEMMRLASSDIFCLHYPNHPLSKVIDTIATQIMD